MDQSSSPTEKSLLLKIADKLTQAQQELDELAVQLSLGKADAADKFVEIKSELTASVNQLKQMIRSDKNDQWADTIKKIAALNALLESGSAGTKEQFEELKKKILKKLHALELVLKDKFLTPEAAFHFTNEFEKFKLKLEILGLKFIVKKFQVKDEFRSGMKNVSKEVTGILEGTAKTFKKSKEKYHDFSTEITQAYKHLGKVIKNL